MLKCGLFLSLWLMVCSTAWATSVDAVDHDCPVCKRPVQLMVLMSYSQFGEAPRNLSSMLGGMTEPQLCPHDLFVDYASNWKEVDQQTAARLKPILDKRVIRLTEAEKLQLKQHGPSFFESVKTLLWYRTCLPEFGGKQHARRDFRLALQLYYRSYDEGTTSFYREQLIGQLEVLPESGWLNKEWEPLVYAYLHAELLRESGRVQPAIEAFRKVIDRYGKFSGKNDENGWISEWAQEQMTRALFSTLGAEELKGHVMVDWLDPDVFGRDKHPGRAAPKKWLKHQIAMETLYERMGQAGDGAAQAGGVLNDLFAKKVSRLLAADETLDLSFTTLVKHPEIREWLRQLRQELLKGGLFSDTNDEELKALRQRDLAGILGESRFSGDRWPVYMNLLPHFEQWRKDRSRMAPLPDGWTWQRGLDGYRLLIDEAWKDDAARRHDAVLAFLSILPQVPDQPNEWSWDLVHGLQGIADEQQKLKGLLTPLLQQSWKGVFWKNCVAYLNGTGSAEALAQSPLVSVKVKEELRYEAFLWRFLGNAGDSYWRPKALKLLECDTWLSSEVYSYLGDVFEPAMLGEINQRLQYLRGRMKMKERVKHENEMFGYELDSPEALIRRYHLGTLTYE